MDQVKNVISETKEGLSSEERAALESKIKNLIEQIAEANGDRLDVKTEMALKNKLILPQQEKKLAEVIKNGSELYDRYNGGERTEILLNDLEDYSRRLQEEKNEIWGSMEIIERKSKDIERKPTNKKRKRLNNKKRPENSPLKSPTELAADIADSQPATFKRGGQEFYTEASQPEDAGEEAQRRKSLAFLSEKNNSEDKNMEITGSDQKSEATDKKEVAPEELKPASIEEKKENQSVETSEKKPAEKEKKSEEFLKKARQDYVAVLLAKERAQKDVEKLSGWRRYFQGAKVTEEKPRAEKDLQERETALAAAQGELRDFLKNYRQSEILIKKAELAAAGKSPAETDKELAKFAKELLILTTAKEAIEIHNLKHQQEIENRKQQGERKKWEWIKTKGLETAQWYRKLDWKYKIGIAVGLGGVGMTVGAASGAVGVALATGLVFGRTAQRALGGAATAVGLEALIKSRQEKYHERKLTKEFSGNFLQAVWEKHNYLDKRLFEITGKKDQEERRRYILAIGAGLVVGSGALAQAFGNVIPTEWKQAVFEKLGIKTSVVGGKVGGEHLGISDLPEETSITKEQLVGGRGPVIISENISPESMPKVSGVIKVQKGDSLWKVIERQAETSGLFEGLTGSPEDIAAQKTYVIDALKDKVAASPEKFSLADVDKLKIGQKLDLTEIFKSPQDLDEIVQASGKLSKEQLAHILSNNEILNEWVKTHPSEALTSAKVEEILTGEIPKGKVPWQVKATPDWPAELEIEKPQGGPLPASVEELKGLGLKEEEISNLTERAKLVGKNFVSGNEYESYMGELRGSGYLDRVNEQGLPARPTLEAIGERLEKTIAETMGMESTAYDKIKVMKLDEFIKIKPTAIAEHPEWKPAGKVIDEYLKIHKNLEPKYLRGTTGDFFKKIIKIDIGR